jgi:histidinol-phosphatase (PHP family)
MCPHGSGEPTRTYVERALELGFKKISIIEHYPLPPGFPDPGTPNRVDLDRTLVESYIDEMLALRDEYAGKIDVLVGFEWDYLPGWEDYTRRELERVGHRTQDAIISVHFLHDCLVDEAAEIFVRKCLPKMGGSLEAAYEAYFETLMGAVRIDFGKYKPRRLGHVNLIRKNRKILEPPGEFRDRIIKVVREAASRHMQLDFNMSGLRKKPCGEPFVPQWLVDMIATGEIDIEAVYGSDAHRSEDVGYGLEQAKMMAANTVAL